VQPEQVVKLLTPHYRKENTMQELKTFYILIEYCCHHFEGVWLENELQDLSLKYLGKTFQDISELSIALNDNGYSLKQYTI
jgi:hypothetical protein